MLKTLFSGPIFDRSRIQSGLNAGRTIEESDRFQSNDNGKRTETKHGSYEKKEETLRSPLGREHTAWSSQAPPPGLWDARQ